MPPAARTPPTNSVALTGVKTTGHPLGRQMEVEEREAASGNPQAPFEVSVPGVNRERERERECLCDVSFVIVFVISLDGVPLGHIFEENEESCTSSP